MKTSILLGAAVVATLAMTGVAEAKSSHSKSSHTVTAPSTPAAEKRHGKGADDAPGHVRHGQGADDPAGDDKGGQGLDDAAVDDHGVDAAPHAAHGHGKHGGKKKAEDTVHHGADD